MKKKQLSALILFAMKITLIPVCILMISASTLLAKDGKSQELLLKKRIKLDMHDSELKSVLFSIQKQTGFCFIYSSKAIGAERKISVTSQAKNIGDFIQNVLTPMHIDYKITDNKILLFSKTERNIEDGIIKATVKSVKGEILSDVTIQILNTKFVTYTDASGNFEFKDIPPGEYTISFSHVGFLTYNIAKTVSGGSIVVNVDLSEDVLKLQDIIVTSSGNPRKKIESSVAITTVSNRDITTRAPLNSTDMLKAIPGLTVESTGGDGPGNVWVRGFPQQGGYIFLGIMEDGLPLLPTGFNSSPSIDQYYKTDLTIKNVEAIRGGNASIILPNTSGAVVNNISYTGAEKSYGQLKFTDGFSQNSYRVDGNTGGALSKNVQYNTGGFYRTDKGIVPPGFTANQGGQIKGNMTFFFNNKKGFLRVYGKYLNDKVEWMLTSYYPYDGSGKPRKYGSFDMVTQSLVPVDTKWDYTDASGDTHHYDLADGIHTKLGSGGLQFNYNTDNGWAISNNFRYQYTNNKTTAAIPSGISAYDGTTPYYYLGGATANLTTGDQIVTDYVIGYKNHDVQIIDFLDFKKKIANHSISFGTAIHQYNRNDGPNYTFYSIQEFKENSKRLLTSNSGNGMTAISAGTTKGNTRTLSVYTSDEITLSSKWRLDIGARLDNQNVKGKRSLSATSVMDGYTDYSETVTNWAVSAGLNYKISNTSAMFARATRAYNAPTIDDYNAVAYNADAIKKRPVYLGEIGYKYAKNNLSLFASASYSAIKNVSLSIAVPTSSGNQSLLAFGSTRTWSGEFEISYKPIQPLNLRLTTTVQNSKYTDYTAHTALSGPIIVGALGDTTYSFTDKKTERVPAVNSELSVTYDYEGLNIYLAGTYVSSRYTSPSDSYKLPAYIIMKGGIGYTFNKHLALRGWVDNLNNARVLTEGDVRGDQFRDFSKVAKGTLMAGRALLPQSFWGSFAYTF